MFTWLAENWGMLVSIIVLAILALAAYGLPTVARIREWLLQAVTQAEAALGSGTGQLKLSTVYDWFIGSWGIIAKIIPFSTFSKMVDKALVTMRELLETNAATANYVAGTDGVEGAGLHGGALLGVDYDDLLVDALRRLAQEAGIENYDSMERAALITALKERGAG